MRTPALLVAAALSLLPPAAHAQNPLLEPVTTAQGPSYLADPGDGRLFISELAGYIRIYDGGTLQTRDDAYLDIHTSIDIGSGEGGLHSLAFDPDYSSNRRLFVAYTRTGSGGSPLETVIARYTTFQNDPNHADPASEHVVITLQSPVGAQYDNHKGGQLQFGPDDMLYFAWGDGGGQDNPSCGAQEHDVLFGKMIRIDPNGEDFPGDPNRNYSIPSSNPYSDPNDGILDEIWASGFRNPYRFSFDRQTGDLWIGDVGGSIREEVDMDPSPNRGRGKNYGWKVHEGTTCHTTDLTLGNCAAYVAPCGDPSYTPPLFEYQHGGGDVVTGGYVYRGATSAWRGRYIFADFGRSDIYALIHNGGTWERVVLSDNDVSGPASFGQDHNGELYVLGLLDSRIYRLRFDLLGQTKTEQACVRKLNEGFLKLADAVSSQVRSCVDKSAGGKLGAQTADECVAADPRDKLAKLRTKNGAVDTDLCDVPPSVGYAGAGAGNDAVGLAELGLAHDVLGATLQTAIIPKASDKNGAACQKAVLSALASCQKMRRAQFLSCKKLGLKEHTLLDDADLAQCLDVDPKAKIAKACDPATGKIRAKAIASSCTKKAVDLSTAFPGCNVDDPAALAECLDQAGRCRNCELFDAADSLDTDCSACD